MVKFFLTLFYIRLPSNVTIFLETRLNQAHVLKAQDKCSLLLLFTQNQQIFLVNDNFLVDEYHLIMWISEPTNVSNQRQLLEFC